MVTFEIDIARRLSQVAGPEAALDVEAASKTRPTLPSAVLYLMFMMDRRSSIERRDE
jgi:hypothetical protein